LVGLHHCADCTCDYKQSFQIQKNVPPVGARIYF
jgi:hypothetical protein